MWVGNEVAAVEMSKAAPFSQDLKQGVAFPFCRSHLEPKAPKALVTPRSLVVMDAGKSCTGDIHGKTMQSQHAARRVKSRSVVAVWQSVRFCPERA